MEDKQVRAKYAQALEMMSSGNEEKSIDCMKIIIKEHPYFLEAYEGLSVLYSNKGMLDEAIELMKQVLKQNPEHMMAHTNLSIYYMKKGMKDIAEEWKAKATVLQFSRNSKK